MSANPLSREQGTERLRARRRRARTWLLGALGIFVLLLVGASLWWAWQPSSRIQSVTVYGGDPALADIATSVMHGTYFHILPRNSVFFYPAHDIRVAVLTAHPDIASVSLFREGLTELTLKVIERVPVARWCGLAPTAAGTIDGEYCYVFDASGEVYAAASSTDKLLSPFKLYALLAASSTEPLGATLQSADQIPAAFDFARKLSALGGTVESVVIRGDEVDDIIASSSTRVTYLLGDERDAYAALTSAKEDYNLSDGSIQYLDLRFPAKIYLKRN